MSAPEPPRPGLRAVMRHLLRFARPVRSALGLGLLASLVGVGVSLAQPWPLQWVIDNVLRPAGDGGTPGTDAQLAAAVGAFLAIVAAGAVADYWSTRLMSSAGLHIANGMREAVFAHLQRLSLRYHGGQSVGDLSTRVTSDVDKAQDMVVQTLAVLIPNVLLLGGMTAVMAALDPTFTLLVAATTPPLVIATFRSSRRLTVASRTARRADGAVASAATEGLGAIHLVQAFALEDEQRRRFSTLSHGSLRAGLESVRLQARFSPVVDLSAALSTAVILWFGAHRVLEGRMTLGVLLVFMSYLASLYKPIRQLARLNIVLARGGAAAERVVTVLAETPNVADRPGAMRAPALRGRISLRGVRFSSGREPVLDGLDLDVGEGETVALVGPTGAGKSTIASLVPRLVDPDEGVVRLDGYDVRGLQLHSIRSQISMVLQDTVLMRGSLRDNIAWGRPGATEAQILRAVRLGLVEEFASRLPDGLDTPIGERGANLSGGQRQRVAIARAILRDAPILILDEPTSALDAASEALLVEALRNLPAGRTTLVIAHRLTTIRHADRIAVIGGGRVLEEGTHDALMAVDGPYRRLAAPAPALARR
ncbi:MAG: ABC transporter ATP-binding protein [Thermoleophilia bacterium]